MSDPIAQILARKFYEAFLDQTAGEEYATPKHREMWEDAAEKALSALRNAGYRVEFHGQTPPDQLTVEQFDEIIAMWSARSGGQARMAEAMYRDMKTQQHPAR